MIYQLCRDFVFGPFILPLANLVQLSKHLSSRKTREEKERTPVFAQVIYVVQTV
uniref:Uncharacterized protein n=1 Tax=Solanum tuberosum TaxID=4113 RepID=M1CN09_SOLTU